MLDKCVWEFIPEFVEALREQLKEDEVRWGDTWKKRIRGGQEKRIFANLDNYFDQWENGNQPIPWLKVAGLALIGWIRDKYPDEFEE